MNLMPSSSRRRGELGVFRQEAVARVDGLSAGLLAGGDDLVGNQVGLLRGGRADADGFVGQIDEQGVLVGFGIDGNRRDAHLAGGLDDAAGDLAAVSNQNFIEHGFKPFHRKDAKSQRERKEFLGATLASLRLGGGCYSF